MKRILSRFSVLALMLAFVVPSAFAQDAAAQQQIDHLNGQIQDLQDTIARQGKQIDDLTKQLSDLSDKVSTPAANNSASADDLKKLAEQVQEIDQKRQDDRALILKEIEKLGASGAGLSAPPSHHTSHAAPPDDPTANSGPAVPQKGYDYVVQDGDYLSTIAKACRDKGIKVSVSQILKANPGLDPGKLYPGKKIFIPDPNAK